MLSDFLESKHKAFGFRFRRTSQTNTSSIPPHPPSSKGSFALLLANVGWDILLNIDNSALSLLCISFFRIASRPKFCLCEIADSCSYSGNLCESTHEYSIEDSSFDDIDGRSPCISSATNEALAHIRSCGVVFGTWHVFEYIIVLQTATQIICYFLQTFPLLDIALGVF